MGIMYGIFLMMGSAGFISSTVRHPNRTIGFYNKVPPFRGVPVNGVL